VHANPATEGTSGVRWSTTRACGTGALANGLLAYGTLRLLSASGFAMSFWPAAGLALGMVLVLGVRILPGIAVGSWPRP